MSIESRLNSFACALVATRADGEDYSDSEYTDVAALIRRAKADVLVEVGLLLLEALEKTSSE